MATNKSVLSQLQSVGEDAVARIAKSPAARTALEKGNQLKDRAGKTISGLEGIEERLAAIEKRLRDPAGFAFPSRAASRFSIAASRSSIPSSPESVLPARSFSWLPFWRAERAAGLLAIRATASSPTDWSCESTDLFVAIGLKIREKDGFQTIDIC